MTRLCAARQNGARAVRVRRPQRIGDDHEPGAVVEDRLDGHLGNDCRDAGKYLVGGQADSPAVPCISQSGPISGGLADGVGDDRGGLRER